MFNQLMHKGRRLAGIGSVVAALGLAAPVLAQDNKEPIVFGGSIPLSGVFAFAGIHLHAGLTDYTTWINSQGGINGHPVEYVMEDTAYEVDRSVAAFKKISGNDNLATYYGDSTGFMKAIASEVNEMNSCAHERCFLCDRVDEQRAIPLSVHSGTQLQSDVRHHSGIHRQPG
jgi:branched-chain amino acid transport system substrate-binding protein